MEEDIPQSGRARDIYIAEALITYAAYMSLVSAKKAKYNHMTLGELQQMIGFSRYKDLEIKYLPYNEVMSLTKQQLIDLFANADIPEKNLYGEVLEKIGIDPIKIQTLYLSLIERK